MKHKHLFSLSGRTALVTGGTSGIGEMIARGLLMGGAKVCLVGRSPETCEEKAKALSAYGQACWIAADLADPAGVEALAAAAREQLPDLSVLVNNAGITARAPFGEFPVEIWRSVLGVNLIAPFMLIQALHPLLKQNSGADRASHVINTGSVAGLINVSPDSFAYGTSKSALHHLTKILAKRLAPDRIHVNAIAAGMFPSRMTSWIVDNPDSAKRVLSTIPVGRFGSPDDLAVLAIAMVSNSYLTGAIVTLDGGMSL
jgi:NAD(P)-dependent dehydrogenase (short-subunit alcohol dehydrogenase family)